MSNKKLYEHANSKRINKIKDQQEKLDKDKEIDELRMKLDREVDYTLDGSVKQLFLNLTKMQIPFDYEKTLKKFFPENIKTDKHGNYFIKIGDDTLTMFCAHLDTYCYEYKRVYHVIEGNKIKTDGTTTLGGDDKAGVIIMLKMIEAGVPGLYYFFRGEEGVTSPTGTWGSKQAIKSYKENFKKYEKCIAFDRKDTNNLITQQMYSECCSSEFSAQLIKELGEYNLKYYDDPTGMWCDSGVFMEMIPECTNISVGYVDEHTFSETQDIEHLEKLVEACVNIDWESLPVKRDPSVVSYGVGDYHYDYDYKWDHHYSTNKRKSKHEGVRDYVSMDDMFWHIVDILQAVGYESLNESAFEETEEMYFQNHKTGDFFGLKIIDYDIFISEDDTLKNYEHIGDLDTFEKYVSLGSNSDVDNLDADANKHLDSIASEATDDDFTDNQDSAFKDFTFNRPDIINEILKDIKSNNQIAISSDLWIDTEKALLDSDTAVDYGERGINPDDLVDWVAHNWEWCISEVEDSEIGDVEKVDNITEDTDSALSEKEGIFYDIALNQNRLQVELFIKQVIQGGHLDTPEDYELYENSINTWIRKKYSIELERFDNGVNHKEFISWVKKNQDDLMEYYRK